MDGVAVTKFAGNPRACAEFRRYRGNLPQDTIAGNFVAGNFTLIWGISPLFEVKDCPFTVLAAAIRKHPAVGVAMVHNDRNLVLVGEDRDLLQVPTLEHLNT
eukprot:7291199-Pyramimonas_sp.AAC.1